MEQDEDQEMESGSVGVGAWETVQTNATRVSRPVNPASRIKSASRSSLLNRIAIWVVHLAYLSYFPREARTLIPLDWNTPCTEALDQIFFLHI